MRIVGQEMLELLEGSGSVVGRICTCGCFMLLLGILWSYTSELILDKRRASNWCNKNFSFLPYNLKLITYMN
jgi:hypothetical protein